MKYTANPVIVDAYVIVAVVSVSSSLGYTVLLENGESKVIGLEMHIRHEPQIGDYYVVQSDGYTYINPKEVFERKYSPLAESE